MIARAIAAVIVGVGLVVDCVAFALEDVFDYFDR